MFLACKSRLTHILNVGYDARVKKLRRRARVPLPIPRLEILRLDMPRHAREHDGAAPPRVRKRVVELIVLEPWYAGNVAL